MKFTYEEFDLSGVRTYPLKSRASKARREDFAKPLEPGAPVGALVDSLPSILAGADFKAVVRAMVEARRASGIVWGIGAHVIKTGLGPVLIDLMERGFMSAIAANGAAVIHDVEIALVGATSEDVDESLGPGRFGMAEETGRLVNQAINDGARDGLGLGQAIGRFLTACEPQHARASVFASAARLGIPFTIHVAIGTDIIHMHPAADGAAIGAGSLLDFRRLASVVSQMDGGVYLNMGSAVILPEVFLKTVALGRNLGHPLADLTTVNMDFLMHYRPTTNVVRRPTQKGGKGYTLIGHHEIMVPLLAATIIEALGARPTRHT